MKKIKYTYFRHVLLGGDQNFERLNVERPTLRNFKITNIKITKDELFGWGSKFGTSKYRTADISKIRNFEY